MYILLLSFFVGNAPTWKSTSTQCISRILQVQHSMVFTDAACVQPYNTAWCSTTLLVSNRSAPSLPWWKQSTLSAHELDACLHGIRWLLLCRPYWLGLRMKSYLQFIGKRDNDVQARLSVLIVVCFVFEKCSDTLRNLLCGWIIWS